MEKERNSFSLPKMSSNKRTGKISACVISAGQETFSRIIPTREQTGGSNRLFFLLFIIYFKEFRLYHPAARLPLSYSASSHMGNNHAAGAGDAAASRRSPPGSG